MANKIKTLNIAHNETVINSETFGSDSKPRDCGAKFKCGSKWQKNIKNYTDSFNNVIFAIQSVLWFFEHKHGFAFETVGVSGRWINEPKAHIPNAEDVLRAVFEPLYDLIWIDEDFIFHGLKAL